MEEEAKALRDKLLRWADPIAAEGKFNPEALRMIRAGSGRRDMPSDLASLVALFRSSWDTVKGICGVTEADLVRGGQLSMAVFTAVAHRQARTSNARSESNLRVRRAWTCLDRAYDECRRGVAFLLHRQRNAAEVTPNLRDKRGPRAVAARGDRPARAKKRGAAPVVTAAPALAADTPAAASDLPEGAPGGPR
jgi:hypothetical protein